MVMRFNSTVGVIDIRDLLKDNWNYLTLGDANTTYTEPNVTDAVGILTLPSGGLTVTANSFTHAYILYPVPFLGKTITKIFDTTSLTATNVDSYEEIYPIDVSTPDRQYFITITTEILR